METYLNIAYCGISFVAFLILMASVSLSMYLNCKRNSSVEYIETLFLVVSLFLMVFSFIQSLQWFVLFTGRGDAYDIGCIIIGALHQYLIIALLANITCLAIHILLQMRPPKCLQVIAKEKKRKFKRIMCLYLALAAVIPVLFVPWPFIENLYGNNVSLCWISECNEHRANALVLKIVLWFIWPLVIAAFVMVVVIVAFTTLCLHTSQKLNANLCSMLIMLSAFIAVAVMNGIVFALDSNGLTGQLFGIVSISLLLLLCSIVLTVRVIITYRRYKFAFSGFVQMKLSEQLPLLTKNRTGDEHVHINVATSHRAFHL